MTLQEIQTALQEFTTKVTTFRSTNLISGELIQAVSNLESADLLLSQTNRLLETYKSKDKK